MRSTDSPSRCLDPLTTTPAPSRRGWRDFVAVDEGLDQLFRWTPKGDAILWSTRLAEKCRTLQLISPSVVLGVHDKGYFEVEVETGAVLRRAVVEHAGVIAAARCPNGHTFLSGLDLAGSRGVAFAEYDAANVLHRAVSFPGDYVRGATLTAADTILFTNNDRVLEGDWSGRILREFAAPGFKHAWKALRLENDHTIISAGYGAFLVEFDGSAREVRRWQCGPELAFVRPFFFGDFLWRTDGSLVVCNWLGHGTGLGGTGCALLEFDPAGTMVKAWQDAARTSSVQALAFLRDQPTCD